MSAEAAVFEGVVVLLRSDASCAPPLGPWQALQKRQRIKTRMMDRLCMCAPAREGGRLSAAQLGTVDTNLGGTQFQVGRAIREDVRGRLVERLRDKVCQPCEFLWSGFVFDCAWGEPTLRSRPCGAEAVAPLG